MKQQKPKRKIDALTDDEIESCLEGHSNMSLVRDLLKKNQDPNGWIDSVDFGNDFAQAIEGFIDEVPNTKDWNEAWDINCEWGESIAGSINDLLK